LQACRVKPYLSTDGLARQVITRGLGCSHDEAARYFRENNYYRFSGYARSFQRDPRNQDENFASGTTLQQIIKIIDDDHAFRLQLFRALARLELLVRNAFVLAASSVASDGLEIHSADFFQQTETGADTVEAIDRDIGRSKSAPALHFKDSDGGYGRMPVWVLVEEVSFGTLSKMIANVSDESIRHRMSDALSVKRDRLISDVRGMAFARNYCAHHLRFWNSPLTITALKIDKKQRRKYPEHDGKGALSIACVATEWLKANNERSLAEDLLQLLKDLPADYVTGIAYPVR
jgi:abortive infection bacteriophage resistance protein